MLEVNENLNNDRTLFEELSLSCRVIQDHTARIRLYLVTSTSVDSVLHSYSYRFFSGYSSWATHFFWWLSSILYSINLKSTTSILWLYYSRGNLIVRRQSLLPRVLSVAEGAAVCRKPFKPPCSSGYDEGNNQLVRRLSARKRFVPWGSSRPVSCVVPNNLFLLKTAEKDVVEESVTLPPGIDPLILWQPEDSELNVTNLASITVDPLLVRFLRPHQRYHFCSISGYVSVYGHNQKSTKLMSQPEHISNQAGQEGTRVCFIFLSFSSYIGLRLCLSHCSSNSNHEKATIAVK